MKLTIPNLFYILFALLVSSLYLPPVFYTLFTAALVILAGVAVGRGHRPHYRQWLPWLCLGFFGAHFNGFFLGGQSADVLAGLQPKLSFLLLPVVLMVFWQQLTRSFFRKLIASFFISSVLICLLFIGLSVAKAISNFAQLGADGGQDTFRWFYYFYSSNLTHGYIHRSYLGLMLGAVLISSPFIMPIRRTKRILFFSGVGLLVLVLVLLQSRMILIALFVSMMVYAVISIRKARSVKWALYLAGALLALGLAGWYFADSPYNRFRTMQVEEYTMDGEKQSFTGATIRFAIWQNSLEMIKDKPAWGVGYGNLRQARQATYMRTGFAVGQEREYNSHNQFLETQVVAGVPGSVFLWGIFIALCAIAWQRGDTHLFILTLFIMLSMGTEAMFERQWGVSFFCTYLLAMGMGDKVDFKKTSKPSGGRGL